MRINPAAAVTSNVPEPEPETDALMLAGLAALSTRRGRRCTPLF